MIRKMLFVASALAIIALITAGLTLGLPAKTTTSAAATPSAVQTCSFTITVNDLVVGPRKPLGGRDVTVSWAPPANLPGCTKVKEYIVVARLNFPNTFHDNQIKVAGSKTSAVVAVGQTLFNTDPTSVKATVTAVLETIATASGSKTETIAVTTN
jgi:hypothetical protein